MSEVLSVKAWQSNAELIRDAARLGYLDGTVLDVTYGEGAFWRCWAPERLVTSDLHKPADHRWDYRALPLRDGAFDAVVFDPPYKLNGTPANGAKDARYGTTGKTSRVEVLDDILAGAVECYRVTRTWLLVKCMDQVEGGKMRWQTDLVTRAVESLGGRKVDRFDLVVKPQPQPPSRRQLTARHNASQLLVFRKSSRGGRSGDAA
jgi:hypothetical protein